MMRFFFVTNLFYVFFFGVHSELFTSVEELSRWPKISEQFSKIFSEIIKEEETKIDRLRHIQGALEKAIINNLMIDKRADRSNLTQANGTPKSEQMHNPITAFVTLNRLVRAINGLADLLEDLENNDHCFDRNGSVHKSIQQLIHELPNDDDLIGSGEAILRLQMFYDLKTESLICGDMKPQQLDVYRNDKENKLPDEELANRYIMKAEDCFELGRIAFHNDRFALAIKWLFKSLEMCTSSQEEQSEESYEGREELLNNVLEYMAFSAYKLGFIKYSAKLTQAWLERDPQNDRARENLQYYLEELDVMKLEDDDSDEDDGDNNNSPRRAAQEMLSAAEEVSKRNERTIANTYALDEEFDTENYEVTEDVVVRDLCRQSNPSNQKPDGSKQCHLRVHGLKTEVLNNDPKIIRIYNVITPTEADHLRQVASTKLQRSTIHSGASGSQTSNFRIAKTAWISGKEDPIVRRVEDRLSEALGMRMEDSEDLQVVNYGLGGFYGPHLDSVRSTAVKRIDSVQAQKELQRNDRYATILMYLNQVEAGGSTVFPKLNITIEPIERSAVIWFNIREDGHSDERTLHTGCPVLLGSKWIATKWPREAANSFSQPCKRLRANTSTRVLHE